MIKDPSKADGRINLFLNPRLWIWLVLFFTFVICGSIFWIHHRQQDTYRRTVSSLRIMHEARNELFKGLLYTSLSGASKAPYDRAQGKALLEQSVDSLADAVRSSSRNERDVSETLAAVERFRESIRRFDQRVDEIQASRKDLAQWESDVRIEFAKLDEESENITELTETNLSHLSYRLNLEFGLVYFVGFLLLAGCSAAIVISQFAENRSLGELRDAKEQLQQVVHATGVGLWDWDVQTGQVFYSNEWKSIIGYDDGDGDAIDDSIDELKSRLHPDDVAEILESGKRDLDNRSTKRQYEYRLRHRDGNYRRIISSVSAWYQNDKPVRVVGVDVDITAIKATEEKLLQSEERFKMLVDEAPECIFITAGDKFVYVNQAAVDVFGFESREAMIGMSIMDLAVPERAEVTRERVINVTTKGATLSDIECEINRFDRSVMSIEYSAIPFDFEGQTGALFFVRDTSQRKRLEAELAQSQKMESIGRLAGGVAHDFNNLLTVMLAYSGLAEKRVGDDDKLRSYVRNIREASEKARGLTQQLLGFARKQIIMPQVLSLNDEIVKFSALVRRLIGEDIEVSFFPADDLWPVRADAGQIEQVIMNLAANARDSMPDGGRLTIETDNVSLDENYARQHPEVTPGEFVLMAITDTGSGIPKDAQDHVFEPFFTTKEHGKGTGLGLATCHGIVKQNNGHIWFYSEEGRGTTFKIYLPRAEAENSTPAEASAPREVRGSETILVVEDEAMVRGITVETLRSFGYDVVECSSGEEALEKAREMKGRIDLLVTDVVMPKMSGKQLAIEIRKESPGIKILFVSGYTDNTIVHHGVLEEEVNFVAKPFNIDHLGAKIREILERS